MATGTHASAMYSLLLVNSVVITLLWCTSFIFFVKPNRRLSSNARGDVFLLWIPQQASFYGFCFVLCWQLDNLLWPSPFKVGSHFSCDYVQISKFCRKSQSPVAWSMHRTRATPYTSLAQQQGNVDVQNLDAQNTRADISPHSMLGFSSYATVQWPKEILQPHFELSELLRQCF